MANLIGRVVFQPETPKPGESVRVEVLGGDGQPPTPEVALTINGIPGAVQYLQFAQPGPRRIAVRATGKDGRSERQVATLNVEVMQNALLFKSATAQPDLPMLNVTQGVASPYSATLTLGSFIDPRSRALLDTDPPKTPEGSRFVMRSAVTALDAPDLPDDQIASTEPRYEWDFGDGQTATTHSPAAEHDYFRAIDHARGYGQFVVTCRAAHSDVTVKRTLTIQSAYALCRRTGTISTHVTSDVYAHKRDSRISGTFTVDNVEAQPLVLDRLSVTAHGDDSDALGLVQPFVELENALTIPAKSTSAISVNIPFVAATPKNGELRFDVRAFTVLYAGSCGALPVRCSAVFELPASEWERRPEALQLASARSSAREPGSWPWEEVERSIGRVQTREKLAPVHLDRRTGTVAVTLGALRSPQLPKARKAAERVFAAAHAPLHTRAEELRRVAPLSRAIMALAPQPGPIVEGESCDPDNLTEQDRTHAEGAGLVCQLTDEVTDVRMPARWMNARKGDAVLSPGGDGIIGGLMLNVSPPQWYSHSGIMTRNYDEITHSTGSQAWLMDHLRDDGADGFEPKAIKYVWPGAITQSVEASIDGEPFPDPDRPEKTYMVSPFGPHTVGISHNDRMVMIPPLVLKPDPLQETPVIREALHAIAEDARASAGRPGVTSKFHYRWYCYTEPKLGQGPAAGPEAGWAEGTRPSVCSSFIWLHAKARGAKLESDQSTVSAGDLEPSDVATGAAVRASTPDGLYKYTKAERLNAGEWLYDTIYNMAYDRAGWFGNILTDAADDLANQFLNAFANDDDDGTDSEAWRNTRDADAVSPDDMLWWDSPSTGGLYGYAEPALYREPRVERYRVSRWKRVDARGTLRGHVLNAGGEAVGGALVQAYDGKNVLSAGDGSYELVEVPFGQYALKASKVIDGVLQSAEVPIELTAAELETDITLMLPEERYRLAQVRIDFRGRDEENFGSDEIYDPGPEYFELELGPDKQSGSSARTYRWGGELRVEYVITLRWLTNNAVDVVVQGTLYEGTSEDTTDLDGRGRLTFQVQADRTRAGKLTITNTAEGDDDAGVLDISVENARNTN